MKVKRYKHAKRTMMFYKNNFSITPPFHVLVDGTFCKAALKFQVNIQDQLPKYLGGEVRLYTTRCCLNECEAFGEFETKFISGNPHSTNVSHQKWVELQLTVVMWMYRLHFNHAKKTKISLSPSLLNIFS